jgi:uncharacterized protein
MRRPILSHVPPRIPGLQELGPIRARMVNMIPQDLLDILVCPACKKSLVLKENPPSLKCAECLRVYPVQDGIPILLIDAATVDAS